MAAACVRGGALGGAIFALAALSAACSRPPSARLVRLGLGEPRLRELGARTRPAVALLPGASLAEDVDLPAGSRLRVSWGVLRNAPRGGFAELDVVAGGAVLFSGRLAASPRGGQWQSSTIALDRGVRGRLVFQARHVDEAGHTIAPDAASEAWIGVAAPRAYVPQDRKPRILVWISQDTVRADHLGAYGYTRATSPGFDRLAASLVLFEEGVAPASWTLPAMASQFTSRYPSAHGAVTERRRCDERHDTVFEALARDGFTVLGVTGNGFVSRHFGLADGFDALFSTPRRAEDVNQLVSQILAEWGGGDLALFVHYMDPHAGYDPPPPYDHFDPGYRGRFDGENFRRLKRNAGPGDVAHVVSLYDGELAYTDNRIDALLRELKSQGLLAGAVVAYTADHGEEFLEHGHWTHGTTLNHELLHVPFALGLPGVAPRRISRPVSLIDVAPTLLEVLGVPRPASFQGRSLMPLLRGGDWREDPLLSETEYGSDGIHQVAVRDGSLKYVLTTRQGSQLPPPILREVLYDLSRDPAERSPLTSHPALERLRRHAVEHLTLARSVPPAGAEADIPPELEQRLRALGYIQ